MWSPAARFATARKPAQKRQRHWLEGLWDHRGTVEKGDERRHRQVHPSSAHRECLIRFAGSHFLLLTPWGLRACPDDSTFSVWTTQLCRVYVVLSQDQGSEGLPWSPHVICVDDATVSYLFCTLSRRDPQHIYIHIYIYVYLNIQYIFI